jgi:hypothetical protein
VLVRVLGSVFAALRRWLDQGQGQGQDQGQDQDQDQDQDVGSLARVGEQRDSGDAH